MMIFTLHWNDDKLHANFSAHNLTIFVASFRIQQTNPVKDKDGTGCQNPVPWQNFDLVPLSLYPGTRKEFLSLCPEKLHCPVPLETLIHIPF